MTDNKRKEFREATVRDFAEEIEELLNQDQVRATRIMRRIDESMDNLIKTQKLLQKAS